MPEHLRFQPHNFEEQDTTLVGVEVPVDDAPTTGGRLGARAEVSGRRSTAAMTSRKLQPARQCTTARPVWPTVTESDGSMSSWAGQHAAHCTGPTLRTFLRRESRDSTRWGVDGARAARRSVSPDRVGVAIVVLVHHS